MSVKYGYRGKIAPQYWGSLCEEWKIASTGRNQSPINIITSNTVVSPDLKSIRPEWQADTKVKVLNNGHAPNWFVQTGQHMMTGAGLNGSYEMIQFHIHFSAERSHGSEHAINGRYYPAEIHFVHWKKSYGSFAEALRHKDGLAVVGAFIDMDDNSNAVDAKFNDDLNKSLACIPGVDSSEIVSMRLDEYNLCTEEYYTYPGSLTTPGCTECVVWLLTAKPLIISLSTYEKLQAMESSEGGQLCTPGNYRSVQPLNDRIVVSSFQSDIDSIM